LREAGGESAAHPSIYHNPTRIIFGPGTISGLRGELPDGPVAVITTEGASKRGLTHRVGTLLPGLDLAIVDDVTPNPEPHDLLRQLASLPVGVAAIVAVGGGSVLDSGKVLAALLHGRQEGMPLAALTALAMGGTVERGARLFLAAVPTTAGTGSEVTPFATVWDGEAGKKRSVSGPGLFPDVAILDPELTLSLPRSVTMSTGLDALSQGLEAWWNRNWGPVSDAHALRAVGLALDNLEELLQDPDDLALRSRMLQASLHAGLAISSTRTAVAHSISYPLTLHFGIPHGIACSFTLPAVLRYNGEGDGAARMGALARAMGSNSIEDLASRLSGLLDRLSVKMILREAGFDPERAYTLGQEMITPGRSDNNFRKVGPEDVVQLVAAAWEELA
jgi:alcohol dehydrogenase